MRAFAVALGVVLLAAGDAQPEYHRAMLLWLPGLALVMWGAFSKRKRGSDGR
jgi:hypothetical protein